MIQLVFRSTGSQLAIWTESTGSKTFKRQWHGAKSQIVGTDGKKRPLSVSGTMYRIPEIIPAYACDEKALVPFSAVHWIGSEQRGERLVDHLLIRMDDRKLGRLDEKTRSQIQSFDLYLDSQSHTVVALSRYIASDEALENRLLMEWRYQDYTPVAGVQVPSTVKSFANGHAYDTIALSNVSVGNPLTEVDFQ